MNIDSAQRKPRLRWPLDIQKCNVNGRVFFVIRDHLGITPEPVIIPKELAPIISRFDGTRSLHEIVSEGADYGITLELVLRLTEDLGKMYLLDDDDARLRWEGIRQEFRNKTVRSAVLTGRVYPAEVTELITLLNGYRDKVENKVNTIPSGNTVLGIMAPHIDYQRGWKTYASSYSVLEQIEKPDVIFIFGTAHQQGDSGVFHLTDKNFDTPFGAVPAAKDVIIRLCAKQGGQRLLDNEILHKSEHSIELQLPFIAHRYKNESLPSIVPILVGSFYDHVLANQPPICSNEVCEFVEAIVEEARQLRSHSQKILFYAAVDLAHVGLHFGDKKAMSNGYLEVIEKRDQDLLRSVTSADIQGLFSHIAEDQDARRICGFPSIYTMLAIMNKLNSAINGYVVEYRQAIEPHSDCIVTFSSAYWLE